MSASQRMLRLPSVPLPRGTERFDRRRLARRALENTAIELFREGIITAGYAARLLGKTRRGFYDLLAQRGFQMSPLGEEELAKQLADLDGSPVGQEEEGR